MDRHGRQSSGGVVTDAILDEAKLGQVGSLAGSHPLLMVGMTPPKRAAFDLV